MFAVSLVCHIHFSVCVIDTGNLSFVSRLYACQVVSFMVCSNCCIYVCKMFIHVILLGLGTPSDFLFKIVLIRICQFQYSCDSYIMESVLQFT